MTKGRAALPSGFEDAAKSGAPCAEKLLTPIHFSPRGFVTHPWICYASRDNMRRFLANLVFCVMLWSSLAPLALTATGNATPACCRRNGKHHCMSGISGSAVSNDGGPIFRALPADCPYRSQIATLTAAARLEASTLSAPHSLSGILVPSANRVASDSRSRGSISQRGPPA
jgi:hypothetical protein